MPSFLFGGDCVKINAPLDKEKADGVEFSICFSTSSMWSLFSFRCSGFSVKL